MFELPDSIVSVTLHKRGGLGLLAHVFLMGLIATSMRFCYNTAGDPLRAATEEMAAITARRVAENLAMISNGTCTNEVAGVCMDAPTGAEKGEGEGEAEATWSDVETFGVAAPPVPAGEDEEVPMPSAWLPGFWAVFSMAASVTVYVLFYLMCHWSVRFNALMNYRRTKKLEEGSWVRVHPAKHQGKAMIVPVLRSSVTDRLFFVFQRQKFEYLEPGEDKQHPDGIVRMMKCPSDLPLRHYLMGQRGLSSERGVKLATDKFGPNIFEIPMPAFMDLYKAQLMSPVAVFQLFCTILWMLDDMWKYTLFTLVSVLGFEASTAFSRLKNLKTMRGMGNASFMVHVLRGGVWSQRSTDELLPGDLVSLRHPPGASSGTVVPADVLILRGGAVVNESTLTGESIPQMKAAMVAADYEKDLERALDMQSGDKAHVMFSGTLMLQHSAHATSEGAVAASAAAPSDGEAEVPPTPDGGCVCLVLRTGFASSQGQLMRMIEFSTEKVTGDSRETALLLMLLFCFAVAASGYVLKKGLEDGSRSKYQLLLRCVLIITSVVPPDLPMQMGIAVNTALMALLKAQVFCTEPYRIPTAGKLTHCLFDKTGTLTTDQLVAVGVADRSSEATVAKGRTRPVASIHKAHKARPEAAIVVAACHSLIEVEKQLMGDPIEVTAIRAVGWLYDTESQKAFIPPASAAEESKTLAAAPPPAGGAPAAPPTPAEVAAAEAEQRKKLQQWMRHSPCTAQIVHRHHFSSALQRMSVVARVSTKDQAAQVWSLVKGSPEAIRKLLAPGDPEACPPWYDATYRSMAERGMRVLALAFKRTSATAEEAAAWPREEAESGLMFAGFMAFTCLPRKDTGAVVTELINANHGVAMITGDAALTALHVANDVGISKHPRAAALELVAAPSKDSAPGGARLHWVSSIERADGSPGEDIPFTAAGIPALAATHDLMVSGSSLSEAVAQDPATWQHMEHIAVFARMSPEGKGQVIKALNDLGHGTLMCGDGGNDVGALKAADVGLALLSGWSNVNADSADDVTGQVDEEALAVKRSKSAATLISTGQELMAKQNEQRKKYAEEAAARKKRMMERQKVMLEEEMRRREAAGDVGVMSSVNALKKVMGELREEMKREAEESAAKNKEHGGALAAQAAMLGGGEGLEDAGVPMVKLGDASIAAPFTSKMPSIRSVLDVIRQGRCTLVNTVQQQQILMLNCMISAFSLSVMHLEGSRSSEEQLISTGLLLTVASFAFSFAQPIKELSGIKPLTSVFHPALFLSVMGQLSIHITCMVWCVKSAKEMMGEEEVAAAIAAAKEFAKNPEGADGKLKHRPSLLNTVVFLVETCQQVSVMLVNYKGRPWMTGMLANQGLLYSICATIAGLVLCVSESVPFVNKYLGLVPLPGAEYKHKMMLVVAVSVVGAFLWDRLCVWMFAPRIFKAMADEFRSIGPEDFKKHIKTLVYGVVILGAISVGGIFGIIGLWFMWNKQKQARLAMERAAAAGPAAGGGGAVAAPSS